MPVSSFVRSFVKRLVLVLACSAGAVAFAQSTNGSFNAPRYLPPAGTTGTPGPGSERSTDSLQGPNAPRTTRPGTEPSRDGRSRNQDRITGDMLDDGELRDERRTGISCSSSRRHSSLTAFLGMIKGSKSGQS